MKNLFVIIFLFVCAFFVPSKIHAQSSNCATATPITLTSGTACVNGTNVGATSTTYTGSGCPGGTVELVWYTYTAYGSNNTFTVTPGTMTNPMIMITFSCPTGSVSTIQTCSTTTGSTPVQATWGMTAGQTVYIAVASKGGTDGTFQLCVNSQPPAPGAGNTCSQAIPICTLPFSVATMANNSSGQTPNCFVSPAQQDIFIQFTVTKSGTLAWTATPNNSSTEFDWCLWDISGGCPGTVKCCNYDFSSGSTLGFGMQAQTGTVACGYNGAPLVPKPKQEFCAPIAVTCGQTYAIQISNYYSDNTGFSLSFTNSTCMISSNAAFSATPTFTCGTSLTASISNTSTGDCSAVWDYGDGSATYTGSTPPNHTYSTPGTYAITETIPGVCNSTATHYVQLLAPLALTATATPVNCSGQCTGTASVSAVTGGDGIYTYSWSPGGNTTNSVSALCAGTYSVTASNAKCGTSVTQTVSVIAPPALTLTPTPTNPTSCGATNGSVSLAASGGTATYSYNINGGAYGASTNFTGLGAGTYTMGVKDSKGCTLTATVTLTNGAGPTVTVNSPTICSGNSTVLTASGATTYSWSPATGLSTTTGANPTANPTVTTTYTVVGTTSTCTASATSVVTITPPPTVTVASATVCPGASTTLSASGASTYTWAPTGSLSSSTGSTVTATPASTTVYTITGTSAASCTSTTTATVTIGSGITPTVPSATICNGSSTTLNASGGTTYTWSPATGLSATTGTSVIASPASTTTYTINAATGACTGTTTAVVTVNPLPPVTVNSPSVCIGGNATLTANGATTYSWSPAAGLSATTGANVTANPTVTTTYTVVGTTSSCTAQATSTVTINPLPTVTSTSASICPGGTGTITASGASTYSWNTGATTATISDNPAVTTNYTVTGTSAAGCVNSATTTINVLAGISITPPSATICVNGSATLTASGATSYTWSPATGLSSTNGASVVSNNTVSTTYTITGSTGTCSATATATLVVNPLPPVAVNGATICAGQQTATLTAVGATSYNWNPSTGLSSSSGGSVTATPATTTSYTVTGTDGNGCVNTATTTVTVNPLPTITVVSTTICPTSTGTLTASGASTYTWNTGATGPSFTDSPVVTTTYTVAGTDANGCFAGNTGTITINPSIVVTAGNNTPICAGGTINLTTTSGTVWSWTGPGGYASSSQNPTIINATTSMSGTYSLTATDASGCQGSTTTNVIVNPLPVLSIGSNGPICVNQTLNLTSGGGSSYSWNGPGGFTSAQQNPTITGVTATAGGVYTVTVTDGNTCVNTTTLNVVVNPLPVVGVTGSTVCVNGTINLGSTGGAGYSWSWSGPGGYASNQQFPSISPATLADAGTYVVTVTDSKNCVNANAAQVVVNSLPIVSVTTAQICAGTSTSLSASGASTYVWSPTTGLSSSVSSAPVCSPAVTTAYTVTGTDVKGCQSTATTTVVVTPAPAAVITPSITTGCAPVCTGFTNVDTTNASLNTYSWNFGNGQTSSSVAPTSCYNVAGNYTVSLTVTNSIGCKGVSTATVVVYPVPNADFYATPQPTTILDNQIHFYDQTTGGATITTWNWTLAPGIHSTVQNPTMLYGDTGTFVVELVVTSNRGCKDSVIKTIRIDDEFSLYVPNAFSPNGDGVNDIFYAKGEGVRDFKMWIFDRWGNQAFFSDDIYKGWDGRCRAKGSEIVQEDVYVWKIQCRTPKGEKKQLSGHVSLIK